MYSRYAGFVKIAGRGIPRAREHWVRFARRATCPSRPAPKNRGRKVAQNGIKIRPLPNHRTWEPAHSTSLRSLCTWDLLLSVGEDGERNVARPARRPLAFSEWNPTYAGFWAVSIAPESVLSGSGPRPILTLTSPVYVPMGLVDRGWLLPTACNMGAPTGGDSVV